MAIRNIFKKKKSVIEKKEVEKSLEEPKEIKEEITGASKKEKKITIGDTYRILKTPHITEKATVLAENNQYLFEVYPKANKSEIKKAIEGLYNVDVLKVRIVNIPKKRRRVGKTLGWRKGYRKAIAKIKEGQKIEVLPR